MPEFTHSSEVSFLNTLGTIAMVSSIYHRHSTQVIQRVTTRTEDGANLSRPTNLGNRDALGYELNLNVDLAEWVNLSLNGNLYYQKTRGFFEGVDLSAETFTATSRVQTNYKLPGGLEGQISYNYRAPEVRPQGRSLSLHVVNAGIFKDIWNNNATITLSVQDLFNSRVWRSETNLPDSEIISFFQWRERQFQLSFNYRLNQKKQRGRSGNYEGGDDF
jgi:outer membrane receptor protein involved in Fe transport